MRARGGVGRGACLKVRPYKGVGTWETDKGTWQGQKGTRWVRLAKGMAGNGPRNHGDGQEWGKVT